MNDETKKHWLDRLGGFVMISVMRRIPIYAVLVLVVFLTLGACKSEDETPVATLDATLTSIAELESSSTEVESTELIKTATSGSPYPPGGGGVGFAYPPAIPYPEPQGQYPPPVPAYPSGQDPSPPVSSPQPAVELLPSGAYPAPPTPANPWTTVLPGQETTDAPSLTPAGGQTPTPTLSPAPGTTATNEAYPAPTGQPTPVQGVSPTPTLTPTPTPTLTPTATPTPIPTRVPVSSRMIATDPKTVELESGQIQFVEFFAFWDGYSKSMAPIVHQLEARYGEEINFVYLDIDDPATKEFKLTLGYQIQPHFFLLDQEGEIIEQWIGLVKESEFESVIQAVLE